MSGRNITTAALLTIQSELTERDLVLLKYVSELRFVTGAQLTRLCFHGSDDRAARRTLLRLIKLDTLERLPRSVGGVRSGSAGFVYRLGLAGQRLAILRGWQPERRTRRWLVPGSLFVAHTLQVAELHTQLIEAERAGHVELLERASEPVCWRRIDQLGADPPTLKPDSFVRLGIGPYEDSYFIEVDRGTEGTLTIVRQLSIYSAYHASGVEQVKHGVFPLVLWLTATAERVAVIESCVQHLEHDHRELFRVARFADALTVMLGTESANP
ncbi:MAG TPA: replication-relaxation family protein [Solirubrobacteraceae bacterium]|jgi:hypothetical protein|nr:replication-relaxation family protein [Solirubrobacteraceae bacterium]